MGITIVSSAAALNAGNPASALQPAADSGTAEFSALFGQQLAANPRFLDLQLRADKSANAEDALPADPASLMAAAGLFPGLMAGINQGIANQSRALGDESLSGMDKLGADGGGKRPLDLGDAGKELLNLKSGGKGLGEDTGRLAADPLAMTKSHGLAAAEAAKIAVDGQAGANGGSSFAAALAFHSAIQASQSKNETAPAAPQISVPLGDSRWAQDFSDKIVWLAKADQQVAQISINPPQLGPMHITLNLSGDQATMLFASPHAEVRQAIQDALPHLREMLSSAGIDLGQANVGAQLPGQNGGTPQQFSDSHHFDSDDAILHGDSGHGVISLPQPLRVGRGMVDLFA